MIRLQVSLKPADKKLWDSICSDKDFEYTTQGGILSVLMHSWITHRSLKKESSAAKNKSAFERIIEPDLSAHDGSDDYVDPATVPGTPEYNDMLARLLED